MLKIGIAGCGKIAQVRHIPEYSENPDCALHGFFDLNRERARALAAQYGCVCYDSAEEMFADPEIDAVSICTANSAHAEMTVKALRAGKHVLCEKPMAVTLEQCEKMVRAAEETGKYLMIGQNQRLTRAHQLARQFVAEGEIGRVVTFRTAFGHGGPETWSISPGKNTWFFDRNQAAMGAMADLGIHKTDLIQYLLGQKIVRATAKLMTLDKRGADGELIGVDDNAICVYEMSGGAVGTLTASWTYYASEDNSTVLFGTLGEIRIYDDPAHPVVLRKIGQPPRYFDVEQIQTNDHQTKSGVIDAFVDCIVHHHPPEISGQSVLSAMRAVFAAQKSSECGQAVEIPENRSSFL